MAAAWVATRTSISPSAIASTMARAPSASKTVSEEKIATRASGKRWRTSSSMRSTPGPIEARLSAAPQWGQRSGLGIEKPVRWQTSRPE